jgi:GNAT superfamily N-acetyltransferase
MHTRLAIRVGTNRSISIRAIEPADAAPLRAFYGVLSAESRRRRFLGGSSGITVQQAEKFAGELGVVAVLHEQGPDDGAVVGHACLPLIEPTVAEAAFAIADAYQGAGVGRALLAAAIRAARASGIRRLTASMFVGNAAIHRLLLGTGLPYRQIAGSCGVDGIEIELDEGREGLPIGRPKGTSPVRKRPPQRGRSAHSPRSVAAVR